MSKFDNFIKELQEDKTIPENVRLRYADTLANLPEIKEEKKPIVRYRRFAAIAAMAAVAVGFALFCAGNPALAKKLPWIGHIFGSMQENFRYEGDYSDIGTPLEEESIAEQMETAANAEEMESISQYTETSDGITITLSEIYCNGQAVYLTMQLKSEEKFPEAFTSFQFHEQETYSFNPSVQVGDAVLEGEFLDAYTYAGMIRLDLNEKTNDYEHAELVEIPEDFTLDLSFELIRAPINLEGMAEEERDAFVAAWSAEHPDWDEERTPCYEGSWEFHLDVQQDMSSTETVEIQEQNELGIGLEKVTKDRFEITAYESYANEEDVFAYIPVFLDANGQLFEDGGVRTVAIGDRDASKIDVFLFDYDKWMDEVKVIYWSQPEGYWDSPDARTEDGRTFRELLMENCAYHKEICFTDENP